MIKIAGGIRKSPTNKGVEESIDIQKTAIINYCDYTFGKDKFSITWFIDKHISGDDPNRPELLKFFETKGNYEYCVFHVTDRYTRSWLGLMWFMQHFTTNYGNSPHTGCKLAFVEGIPELYDSNNELNLMSFFSFAMMCVFAMFELMNIRKRTQRGRNRLSAEEWRLKYPGRKIGSKNKK